MSIGIYSGTFDPVHEGHILFAQVAIEQFGLDKVLMIPEMQPRQKDNVAEVEDRTNMIVIAAQTVEGAIEPLNLDDQPSHTVEGVFSKIYELYPDDEYFLLMGADVFEGIKSWGSENKLDGRVEDIAKNVGFVVGVLSTDDLPKLQKISDDIGLNTRFIEVPIPNISSSKIRTAIASGAQARGLNDDVEEYIKTNNLYSPS
jgi:nicotinate-nucleotide adenylyltransferase